MPIAALDRIGLELGVPACWPILLAAGPVLLALDPGRRRAGLMLDRLGLYSDGRRPDLLGADLRELEARRPRLGATSGRIRIGLFLDPLPTNRPEPPPTMPARTLELAGATVQVFPDADTACRAAADAIARLVREAVGSQGKAVLGLATGNTPVPVYARLVALARAGELSFDGVSTYNLDEYYPMAPTDPVSYRRYMQRHLFDHVTIAPDRAHLLDGTVPEAFADEQGAAFDRWIAADGGLDLQLLGIGRNGHIGFNEPTDLPVESARALPTRLAALHPTTIADAAADFSGSEAAVPRRALTMGVAPILAARSILVLAFGPKKAEILAKALLGPTTAAVPASLLQLAPGRVSWMVDEAAASALG